MLRSVLDLPGRAQWSQRYRELVAYREQNGHCCVPKAQGSLGRWVARQRELRRKRQLYSEREAKLDALGFVWNTNDHAWDAKFERLQAWKAHHGHACVPIAEGDLGVWVAKQRQLKRNKRLAIGREERLDNLGFVWDTPNTDWNEKFEALVRWKTVCGDCRVPFNEGELGWWVNTQRQRKRKGKLTKEREDRLNAIGFIWNPQGIQPSQGPATSALNTIAGSGGAGPSSAPQPNAGSDARGSSKTRRRKRRISDDRSSLGSKRHHSDLSDSSAPSHSFLPRHGYSTSSQSSFDSFRDSDRSASIQPPHHWRGAASPSSSASGTDFEDHLLPPVSSAVAEADSGNPNTLAPLQNLPYAGTGFQAPGVAPFSSQILPSLEAPPQSAAGQRSSFTAWTLGFPRRNFSNRRSMSTFEQLPSVHTLGAPPPAPFSPATSAGRSSVHTAPSSHWAGPSTPRGRPNSSTLLSSSKTAVSSLLAPMPEPNNASSSRQPRPNLRQHSMGGFNVDRSTQREQQPGPGSASGSGGLFDTLRPSQSSQGRMFQFGSGFQRGR